MNIERRLQHAARDLREVVVEVPELGSRQPERRSIARRLQVAAVPMLFVAAGLVAMTGVQSTGPAPIQSDTDPVVPVATVDAPASSDVETVEASAPEPIRLEDELAMISASAPGLPVTEVAEVADVADVVEPDAALLVGPI